MIQWQKTIENIIWVYNRAIELRAMRQRQQIIVCYTNYFWISR